MTEILIILWICLACLIGLLFAAYNTWQTSKIKIQPSHDETDSLLTGNSRVLADVAKIARLISDGADAFLFKEYSWLLMFVTVFGTVIFLLLGFGHNWSSGVFSALAFVVGALTSVVSGYLGMRIAVYANSRTAIAAQTSFSAAFAAAFRAGSVMGFALVSLALLVLVIVINLWKLYFTNAYQDLETTKHMYECIAGYGLGGSAIALFGRVGGGI